MNATAIYKACQHFETTVAEDEEDDPVTEMPDSFRDLFIAARKNKEARQELAKEESPIRAPMKGGGWVLVHRSTKKPGFWQATYFDNNDEPWGDSESPDFARLLYHADGNGIDWLKAERVGRKKSL